MAVFPCSAASISFTPAGGSATTLAGLIDADVSLSMDTIDITESSATNRSYHPGIRSGSAEVNIFYDQTSHGALETAVNTGTLVQFVFTLVPSGATNPASYTTNAYITNFRPKIGVGDVLRASFTLQFSGAVTIA